MSSFPCQVMEEIRPVHFNKLVALELPMLDANA